MCMRLHSFAPFQSQQIRKFFLNIFDDFLVERLQRLEFLIEFVAFRIKNLMICSQNFEKLHTKLLILDSFLLYSVKIGYFGSILNFEK